MRHNILFCFLFAAFIMGTVCVSGETVIESYTHTVEMGEEDSFNEIDVEVKGLEFPGELSFNIPPRTENLEVYIDENRCDFVLEEKKGYSVLTCSLHEIPGAKHFVSVTYHTTYPVFELQDKLMYKSEYIPAYNTSKFVYILKLPVGYIIPDEKDVSYFINPKPKTIYSDGQRIILLWERRNVEEDFEMSVVMEPSAKAASSAPLVTGLFVIVILLLGGYIFSLKRKSPEKADSDSFASTTVTYPALVENEKIVVGLLEKAQGNVMWQKQIQVESDFSKVKVSRVLQSLEKRGVIRKEAWGNTNKIHLVTDEDENTAKKPEQ